MFFTRQPDPKFCNDIAVKRENIEQTNLTMLLGVYSDHHSKHYRTGLDHNQ